MEFPHLDKLKFRFLQTFAAVPKIFLGGFLWEGFALACKCSTYDSSFYWMTGVGSAIGVLVGHVLGQAMYQRASFSIFEETTLAVLYGFCVLFGTGTAWQRIVNDAVAYNMNFNQAFFFMWILAFLLFFASVTFFRKVTELCADKMNQKAVFAHISSSLYCDLLFSFSIGLGDAFFIGTAAPVTFSGNWLDARFAVYSNTPTGIVY
jgi:hypothetical protein